MTSLVVNEVFGPTVQGEGPSTGRRCSFVRLAGCNLHCSWCDTPYTWDADRFDLRAESERRDVADIAARALAGNPGLVVISGGEPLLHQRQPGWAALLAALADVDVEVETNGTIAPDAATAARVTRFNVSPKLAHAGDPHAARIRPDVLRAFAALAPGRAGFKVVCAGPGDVADVAALCDTYAIPRDAVWVMPRGTNTAAITGGFGALVDAAVAAGFNATTRLHVLAWGDERAR